MRNFDHRKYKIVEISSETYIEEMLLENISYNKIFP